MPEGLQSLMWGVLVEFLIIPYIFYSPEVSTIYKVKNYSTGAILLYTNENYLTKENSHTDQEVFT